MIANIFTRTFLVTNSTTNIYYLRDKFPVYDYNTFEKYDTPMEFYTNMKSIILKDNTSSYNFINILDKFEYDKALVDYLSFIGLKDYEDYKGILDHAVLYENMLKDKAHFIDEIESLDPMIDHSIHREYYSITDIQTYSHKFDDFDISDDMDKRLEFYRDIPVEYLYCIYREWKDSIDEDYKNRLYDLFYKKIKSLWLYEVIYIWSRYQVYLFNKGYINLNPVQVTIDNELTSGKYSELKDLLDKREDIVKSIRSIILEDKEFTMDKSIFNMTMEDYILYPSCKGYTDMNLFKFNNTILNRFREKSDDR